MNVLQVVSNEGIHPCTLRILEESMTIAKYLELVVLGSVKTQGMLLCISTTNMNNVNISSQEISFVTIWASLCIPYTSACQFFGSCEHVAFFFVNINNKLELLFLVHVHCKDLQES